MPDQASAAFISYCRDDQEFALRLAQDLKAAGGGVWLDQLDIKPGYPWDNAVEGALRTATKMVVILTPTSVRSENVRDEIAYALKQGKIVIPVLYIECEIPLRLERKQHIDFRANYARGLDLLLRELGVDHSNPAIGRADAKGELPRELTEQQQRDQTEREAHDELRRKQEAEALEVEINRRVQATLREAQERADRQAREAETKQQEEKDRHAREESLRRQEAEAAAQREAEAAEELRRQEAAARKAQEEAERQAREAEARRLQELAERQKQEEAERSAREELLRKQEAERQREAEERAEREAEATRLKEVQLKAQEDAAREAREDAARAQSQRQEEQRTSTEAERDFLEAERQQEPLSQQPSRRLDNSADEPPLESMTDPGGSFLARVQSLMTTVGFVGLCLIGVLIFYLVLTSLK